LKFQTINEAYENSSFKNKSFIQEKSVKLDGFLKKKLKKIKISGDLKIFINLSNHLKFI
jgi:hypothetical protein